MSLTPDSYPTLAALLVNGALGLYVLHRGPRRPANQAFALLMGMLVASGAATLAQKNATSLEEANFLLKFVIFFLAAGAAPIVHFAAVFPQNRPPAPRNLLLLYTAVLAPAGALLFSVENPFRIVVSPASPSGFSVRTAPAVGAPSAALGVELLLLMAYATLRVFRTYRAGGETERAQIRWIAAGLLVAAGGAPIFSVALPQWASIDARGAGSFVAMVPALFATVAIARYRFLVIAPVAEKQAGERPPPEMDPVVTRGEAPPSLESGAVYVGSPDRTRAAFTRLVKGGAHGLCLSRTHPNLLRRELGLEKTPMVWLSHQEEADVMALERPDEIRRTLRNFLSTASLRPSEAAGGLPTASETRSSFGRAGAGGGPAGSLGAAVALDGVEYLVLRFGLEETARLVQDLSDLAALKGAVLLLPVDPKSLGEREMALLGRHARKLE